MTTATILSWLTQSFFFQGVLSLVAVITYLLSTTLTHTAVLRYSNRHHFAERRVAYVKKFIGISYFLLLIIAMAFIWGIDIRGVLIFASSFFAVIGIALFASWSVLSNITSSVILFFSFPFRLGDSIRIIDGDNSIQGKIVDITMFSLHIKDQDDNIVSYPNNLAIQKPILKVSN